jgi:hypothetical protein
MTITRTVTLGRANVPCRCRVCAFFSYGRDEVLRTRPLVIVGEILRENPFYVSSDESLRERGTMIRAAGHATDGQPF